MFPDSDKKQKNQAQRTSKIFCPTFFLKKTKTFFKAQTKDQKKQG